MLRLTLRNLAANKARFMMTTFAVVLGVGFVVSSFVLSGRSPLDVQPALGGHHGRNRPARPSHQRLR